MSENSPDISESSVISGNSDFSETCEFSGWNLKKQVALARVRAMALTLSGEVEDEEDESLLDD